MNFFLVNFFLVHVYNIILPKVLDIIEVIDTTLVAKHNNTKISQIYYNGEDFSRRLSQIHRRSNIT